MNLRKPFYIGHILVDPLKGVVHDDHEQRKISSKSLEILECLITSENRSITHKQLAEKIWNEPVRGAVVYQQVVILRKTLGDDPNNPRFIKTLPKRGYQLVAEVSQPTDNQPFFVRNRHDRTFKACAFIAILVAIGTFLFLAMRPTTLTADEILLDATRYLRLPKKIVGLQVASLTILPENPATEISGTHLRYGLLKCIELLIENHLDQNTDLHILHTPNFTNYKKLTDHFAGKGELLYVLKPQIEAGNEGKFEIKLNIIDPKTGAIKHALSAAIAADFSDLTKFEDLLILKLQELMLIDESQASILSNDSETNLAMIEAAHIMRKLNSIDFLDLADLSEKQQSLLKIERVLAKNRKNLVAYSIMFEIILSMVLSDREFDAGNLLDSIKSHTINMTTLYPDYYKSYHYIAKYHEWNQEQTKSALNTAKAIKMKPFNAGTLLNFSWKLKSAGKDPLPVNEMNYTLNPLNKFIVYFYRNSLLSKNQSSKAVKILDDHLAWDMQPKDWSLYGQTQMSDGNLQEFSHWYRRRFSQIDDSPKAALSAKRLDRSSVPSAYIGYTLLNANQPELAKFWQMYGQEDQRVYFDIRIIEVLADIWQGNLKIEKWQALSDLAEERRKFQTITDKLNIFYMNYYAGLYKQAEKYLLEVFPAFSSPEFSINEGNFRYAVYYADIQKQFGNYSDARRVNDSLKQYLSNLHYPPDRNLDFGIADVEFYALLGNRGKALELLSEAIALGWSANAFWRWPPIEYDIFLSDLRGIPEFEELSLAARRKFKSYCFDTRCEDGQLPR